MKKRLQILEAICIKNKKISINKIAFNTGTSILNILINKKLVNLFPTERFKTKR